MQSQRNLRSPPSGAHDLFLVPIQTEPRSGCIHAVLVVIKVSLSLSLSLSLSFFFLSLSLSVSVCLSVSLSLSLSLSLARGSEVPRGIWLVQGSGFRVSGFGFRVSGFGFRVSGFGFRVSGGTHVTAKCMAVFPVWLQASPPLP